MVEPGNVFKIIMIGDSKVGKTSIVRRYVENNFVLEKASIGANFWTKQEQFGKDTVELRIWDTAGTERLRALTTQYYRNAHAVILVYDVTDGTSFNHLARWLAEIENHSDERALRILIGNKQDVSNERAVPSSWGKFFCEDNAFDGFSETSARSGEGVRGAFRRIAHDLLATKADQQRKQCDFGPVIQLHTTARQNKKCSC